MQLSLSNFRAFAKTNFLQVRPLTLLVGENSSGKTSFLAALSYLWQLREPFSIPSFSKPPFDLGTFDEIVHRSAKGHRAASFLLELENSVEVPRSRSAYKRNRDGDGDYLSGTAKLSLEFFNKLGRAEVTRVLASFSELELSISLEGEVAVEIGTNGVRERLDNSIESNDFVRPNPFDEFDRFDLGYLVHWLTRRFVFPLNDVPSNLAGDQASKLEILLNSIEVMIEDFPSRIFASAPVRSNPVRIYTPTDQARSPDGAHFPQSLFRMSSDNEVRWSLVKSKLEEFGDLSGMFSSIQIQKYVSSISSPFQINITRNGRVSNLADVGYGVSQALPILLDLIDSTPGSGFLFQQPEVHLHPQAQAALASVFVQHIDQNPDAVIVAETHSDYLIDRIRLSLMEGKITPDKVSLLYFEPQGEATAIHQIGLDENGNIFNVPKGYRSFFLNEQKRLLGLED